MAIQIGMDPDGFKTRGGEETGDGRALAPADFDDQPTAGGKVPCRAVGNGAIGGQAVGTVGQGKARLVVANLGGKAGHFGRGDIGRV